MTKWLCGLSRVVTREVTVRQVQMEAAEEPLIVWRIRCTCAAHPVES
ncbi:hypothetical protein IU450_37940 [Nocardia abscessus]|nr:hypothetical protein [Nocardia abscessus]MBF6341618.1 hypothetical protein [Nocardia abscessus]